MNRENSKNSVLLTAAVICAALTSFSMKAQAQTDDLLSLDDSFLGEPAAPAASEAVPAPVVEQNNPFAQADVNPSPAAPAEDPFAPPPADPFAAPEPMPAPAEPVLDLGSPAPAPAPAPSMAPPPMSYAPSPASSQMSLSSAPTEQFLGKLSSDVFREMAEIEQENNTLMLQLKRDKLRSEIDALKTANRQTLFNEIERREKMTQARLEWELEQELKRQAAVERKQQAEIRQKQIEAALKREEERRIQREKEAEMARLKAEEEKKAAEKKLLEEEKKKQDAISLVQVNKIKPTLMAVTRPLKPKRIPSEEALARVTSLGESLLNYKKSGKDLSELSDEDLNIQDLKVEEDTTPPIEQLYAIRGINGTGGKLVVKLFHIENEKILYQTEGNKLPSGHVILKVEKESMTVRKGAKKEEVLQYSAAGFTERSSSRQNTPAPLTGAGSINTLGVALQ